MPTITRKAIVAFGGGRTLAIKPIQVATYERIVTTGVTNVTLANHIYKRGDQVFFRATAGTNPPILGSYTITAVTTNTFSFVDAVTVTAIAAGTACLIGGGGGSSPGFEIVGIVEDATQATAALNALRTGLLPGRGVVSNFENGIFGTIDFTIDY